MEEGAARDDPRCWRTTPFSTHSIRFVGVRSDGVVFGRCDDLRRGVGVGGEGFRYVGAGGGIVRGVGVGDEGFRYVGAGGGIVRGVGVRGEGHRNVGVGGGSFPGIVQGSHGPPPVKTGGCSGQGSAGVMTPLRLRCSPHSRLIENQPGAEFDGAGERSKPGSERLRSPRHLRRSGVMTPAEPCPLQLLALAGGRPWEPCTMPGNDPPRTPTFRGGAPELCLVVSFRAAQGRSIDPHPQTC